MVDSTTCGPGSTGTVFNTKVGTFTIATGRIVWAVGISCAPIDQVVSWRPC